MILLIKNKAHKLLHPSFSFSCHQEQQQAALYYPSAVLHSLVALYIYEEEDNDDGDDDDMSSLVQVGVDKKADKYTFFIQIFMQKGYCFSLLFHSQLMENLLISYFTVSH